MSMATRKLIRSFSAGEKDPYWANVVFLSHFDGADASTTIIDQRGHTISVAGSIALSTAQKKFGTASMKGDSGYTSTARSADFSGFGATDAWTVEGFFYIPSGTASGGKGLLLITADGGGLIGGCHIELFSGTWYFYVYRQLETNGYIGSIPTVYDSFQYFKITNTGSGDPVLYVNESPISISTFGYGSRATPTGGIYTNVMPGEVNPFLGYIDEVRLTKGVARTSSYATPTAPFPNS